MRVAIRKWGNSLALRIPCALAADTHLTSGSHVDIAVENGRLVVAPVSAAVTLDALLAAITADNLHGEVPTGQRIGREAW